MGIPICQQVNQAVITGHTDQVHHPSIYCTANSKIHPSTLYIGLHGFHAM